MTIFSFRHKKPFSLRVRFLLAAASIVIVLSMCYGMVAVIGYSFIFNKASFHLLRGVGNLFFSLAQWKDNKLSIVMPPNIDINFAALVLIYDENGHILWRQRYVPTLESRLHQGWLSRTKTGYFNLDIDTRTSGAMMNNNHSAQGRLKEFNSSDYNILTHSVAINHYPATKRLPPLTIVVVDTIPHELQHNNLAWEWLSCVLLASLLLVALLLWLAACWSLRPIKDLIRQVRELDAGKRERLDENQPCELDILVRNLNIFLNNERQRYQSNHSILSNLTHSLKTPLAVLQTTLRSLRTDRDTNIEMTEPIMLEQISRISQQIDYYLHRRSIIHSDYTMSHEIHSVPPLLDSLCSAMNKVYQCKMVSILLNISPDLTFIGEKNDFMEVMGNVLDNACKYCLKFVEISARKIESALHIIIEDDGSGIPDSKRTLIFQRGQRADTLRPGQGLGLSVAAEILEHYDGDIVISESVFGGALVEVIFKKQRPSSKKQSAQRKPK